MVRCIPGLGGGDFYDDDDDDDDNDDNGEDNDNEDNHNNDDNDKNDNEMTSFFDTTTNLGLTHYCQSVGVDFNDYNSNKQDEDYNGNDHNVDYNYNNDNNETTTKMRL